MATFAASALAPISPPRKLETIATSSTTSTWLASAKLATSTDRRRCCGRPWRCCAERGLSSRRSEASVEIYRTVLWASYSAGRVDPDTRSLRSLLRDDIAVDCARSCGMTLQLTALAPPDDSPRSPGERGVARFHLCWRR